MAIPAETSIALAPPGLLPPFTMRALVRLGVVATLGFATAHGPAAAVVATVYAAMGVALVIWLAGAAWRVRRRGGPPPITVTQTGLQLPSSACSLRLRTIPFSDLRSLVVAGHGRRARLVIDTPMRAFRFPLSSLGGVDAPQRLRGIVRDAVLAQPDGVALWAGIEARNALADGVGRLRPVATWTIAVLLCAAYALQQVIHGTDELALVDFGANGQFLLRAGEWFRPVTANLLHASFGHLVGNVLCLLLIGTIVERLIGLRHTLVVLLVAGISAQLVSAWLGGTLNHYLFSAGFSGPLFGLVAMLAVVNLRFGAQLPAGLRLPRTWWALVVVSAAAGLVASKEVDLWAHGGGALAGAAIGGLLVAARPSARMLRREHVLIDPLCAGLTLVWGVAVGFGAWHAIDPATRLADRGVMARGLLDAPGYPSAIQNAVAWSIVRNPGASVELLGLGRELAARALATETRADAAGAQTAAVADTLAALDYRLGDVAAAVARELTLLHHGAPFLGHLGVFLDRQLRDGGVQTLGDAESGTGSLRLSGGVLHLTVHAPRPRGARIFAVLRRGGTLEGVIAVQVPPGFSGSQVLPIPFSQGEPQTGEPPELWTAVATALEVALFDARGCFCRSPDMRPQFVRIDEAISLPGHPG